MNIPIALQLYSVRKEAAQDLPGVIDQVGRMGYDGVEFAGYHGHSAEELKRAVDAAGLKVAGTHTPMDALADGRFDDTVALHKTLGTRFVIIPWLPEQMRDTPDACRKTAEWLTDVTNRLGSVGLRAGFHCHEGDMRPLNGGPSAWDMIASYTPPEFIMQYDTANGMSGGADPVAPILEWPGRGASVHLKETGGKPIGEGTVPWSRVFEACETVAGTEWYVVEHEAEGELSPMQAVERCLTNLRGMLAAR